MSPEPETTTLEQAPVPESAPVEEPIPAAAAEPTVEPAPAPVVTLSEHAHLALQEIEVFWANYFANAASRVETSVHNFLESEKEALKARIANLF